MHFIGRKSRRSSSDCCLMTGKAISDHHVRVPKRAKKKMGAFVRKNINVSALRFWLPFYCEAVVGFSLASKRWQPHDEAVDDGVGLCFFYNWLLFHLWTVVACLIVGLQVNVCACVVPCVFSSHG